jgi:hypothetical protein
MPDSAPSKKVGGESPPNPNLEIAEALNNIAKAIEQLTNEIAKKAKRDHRGQRTFKKVPRD